MTIEAFLKLHLASQKKTINNETGYREAEEDDKQRMSNAK